MSAPYLEQDFPETRPLPPSDSAYHDVDELVRQIEYTHKASIVWSVLSNSPYFLGAVLLGIFSIAVVYPTTAWSVYVFVIPAVASGIPVIWSVKLMRRWSGEYRKSHLELVQLLREIGPAFAQEGKLSPLRWATIKIQLSQYGI